MLTLSVYKSRTVEVMDHRASVTGVRANIDTDNDPIIGKYLNVLLDLTLVEPIAGGTLYSCPIM